MEKVLEKMAKQLNGLDEASLMSLWDKYAQTAREFEPTRRWEEGALIFCFIQALRWKNMLFNHHWSNWTRLERQKSPGGPEIEDPMFKGLHEAEGPKAEGAVAENAPGEIKRSKVLRFRPREDDKSV